MTRYDSFILYAFLVLLLIRWVLVQMGLQSRSHKIRPWAELEGKRVPRGKGVTLMVAGRWLMGAVYGQDHTGIIVVRTTEGEFEEVVPADIESVRVYDI